jgi:hypothetical protein
VIDATNPRVADLLTSLLVPYSFGAGKPMDGFTSWPRGVRGLQGAIGWDCSGWAQAALVRLGLLDPKAGDRGAAALFDAAKIPIGPISLGDLAFYGDHGKVSHVMLCLSGAAVAGASGGTAATNGDDPKAYVMVRPIHYRADLIGVRRLQTGTV